MADSFAAESGQQHEIDDVPIIIKMDGQIVTEFSMRVINLSDHATEVKRNIINQCLKAPTIMRNNIDGCDLVYTDDCKTEIIQPDNSTLLKYEADLCCNNAALHVVYPRCTNPQQPTQHLDAFSVSVR